MTQKIMIVDDDPAMVEYLEEFFQDNGYETATAFHGLEALDKVEAIRPDLITLDMEMPRKGGTLFYAGIRRNEKLRDTPVIVISGVHPRLSKNVPVLSKPVQGEELLAQVKAFLN